MRGGQPKPRQKVLPAPHLIRSLSRHAAIASRVASAYTSLASRIINTGLLQRQLMLSMAGCSMLIGGVVMLAAGAVIQDVRLMRRRGG